MAEAQSFELFKKKQKSHTHILRTAVTKVVNELEAELPNSDLNVARLSELVENLSIKFEPLPLVDPQLEPLFRPKNSLENLKLPNNIEKKCSFGSLVRKRLTNF
ncbi:hypothetical protein TNCV_2067211 [Trichonephila clavipes]|uniref:Uncharacterized protein n=1 Tax=Trichonephila clavipes TaxID=2585209 RepID=A0A8X6W300_TRICX|nr:hypothetical protein TNCV_2067211 [Trichonephila clavipes]